MNWKLKLSLVGVNISMSFAEMDLLAYVGMR